MRTNGEVLHWLAAPELQNVTGVILAAAWANYWRSWRLERTAGVADKTGQLREPMAQTLGALQRMGLRVLLLGPFPETPYPAPDCIFRAHSESELHRCGNTRAKVDLAQHDNVSALRSAAPQFANVRFLEPTMALCDSAVCWEARDGKIFYSDTHHLSASGAGLVRDRYYTGMILPGRSPPGSSRHNRGNRRTLTLNRMRLRFPLRGAAGPARGAQAAVSNWWRHSSSQRLPMGFSRRSSWRVSMRSSQ